MNKKHQQISTLEPRQVKDQPEFKRAVRTLDQRVQMAHVLATKGRTGLAAKRLAPKVVAVKQQAVKVAHFALDAIQSVADAPAASNLWIFQF